MPRSGARPSPVPGLVQPRRIAQGRTAAAAPSVRVARGWHRQRRPCWQRPACPRSANRMLRRRHRPQQRHRRACCRRGPLQAVQLRSGKTQLAVTAMWRRVSRGRQGMRHTEACWRRCQPASCQYGVLTASAAVSLPMLCLSTCYAASHTCSTAMAMRLHCHLQPMCCAGICVHQFVSC